MITIVLIATAFWLIADVGDQEVFEVVAGELRLREGTEDIYVAKCTLINISQRNAELLSSSFC